MVSPCKAALNLSKKMKDLLLLGVGVRDADIGWISSRLEAA